MLAIPEDEVVVDERAFLLFVDEIFASLDDFVTLLLREVVFNLMFFFVFFGMDEHLNYNSLN
jgi:hypothetical protein